MKFKDVKRYLTINRSEINAYIGLIIKLETHILMSKNLWKI